MDRKKEVKSVLKDWKPVEGKGSLPDIPAEKIATKVKETEDKEEIERIIREMEAREAEEAEDRLLEQEDLERNYAEGARRGWAGPAW